MIFNAGNLNKKIKIYRYSGATTPSDEYGFSTIYRKIAGHKISAYIIPKRGKEYLKDGIAESEIEVIFIVRYRDWIQENMVIEYAGQFYEIKAVIDPYMAHKSLEIYAVKTERGKEYLE